MKATWCFAVTAALVAGLNTTSGVGAAPWSAWADQPTIFERIAGTWDWQGTPDSCNDNPFAISFSDDRAFMTLTYRKPPPLAAGLQHDPEHPTEVRYEVKGQSDTAIRVFMLRPAETRRSAAGSLVVWDLVLVSKDQFHWRRTDWDASGKTRALVRCPAK
jgi:hypothetical protein